MQDGRLAISTPNVRRADPSISDEPIIMCKAHDCTADVRGANRYHQRYRVCQTHSKASYVTVAGLTQRFCQQCSRFQPISEFDDAKRSCRRRLADHNRRRREKRPPRKSAEETAESTAGLTTSMDPTSLLVHQETSNWGSSSSAAPENTYDKSPSAEHNFRLRTSGGFGRPPRDVTLNLQANSVSGTDAHHGLLSSMSIPTPVPLISQSGSVSGTDAYHLHSTGLQDSLPDTFQRSKRKLAVLLGKLQISAGPEHSLQDVGRRAGSSSSLSLLGRVVGLGSEVELSYPLVALQNYSGMELAVWSDIRPAVRRRIMNLEPVPEKSGTGSDQITCTASAPPGLGSRLQRSSSLPIYNGMDPPVCSDTTPIVSRPRATLPSWPRKSGPRSFQQMRTTRFSAGQGRSSSTQNQLPSTLCNLFDTTQRMSRLSLNLPPVPEESRHTSDQQIACTATTSAVHVCSSSTQSQIPTTQCGCQICNSCGSFHEHQCGLSLEVLLPSDQR